MINRIEMELPLPVKVGVFFFNRKRKVGFSFDNLAKFNLRERLNLETPKDLEKWVEASGQNMFLVETLYSAHLSYNMHNRIDRDIDKSKFMIAISKIGEKQTKRLVDCWKKSESYGAKKVPGKKKVAKR